MDQSMVALIKGGFRMTVRTLCRRWIKHYGALIILPRRKEETEMKKLKRKLSASGARPEGEVAKQQGQLRGQMGGGGGGCFGARLEAAAAAVVVSSSTRK